jgi:hypothetical protein
LRQGGDVAIIRRFTKETLEDMLERGEVRRGPTEELLEIYERWDDHDRRNIDKELIDSAGIKMAGGIKSFQLHEVWKLKDVPGEGRRLSKSLYAGHDLILSCRRNPMWNDRCQLISAPQQKLAGAFKGISPIKPGVADLQYYANQIAQQAADSATYSMLPIVMTDPAKNPRTSTMIMNLAAVWECDPQSTRFAEFPKLWQDGLQLIQSLTQQIFQVLGVNPAMMPQSSGGGRGGRRNQAEVAMEQQVDVLTTAEACSVLEEGILTPMLTQWVEMDHQFRDEEVTVRTYGEIGHLAKMESVSPLQSTTRYHFTWFGVEQARNAAQQQQQIAFLNVARGMMQPLQQAGYMLDPAPALEHAAGNIFGWRMGRLIIKDARAMLAMDPELENQMLADGFDVHVHMLDQDPQHIQSHMKAMQQGDPTGAFRIHIQRHQQSMGMKQAQQMQQQAQQQGPPQQPGQPGGGPPQPGRGGPPGAGPPAPGGQPQMPRPVRGPPGMIHPDQMPRAGAAVMPR